MIRRSLRLQEQFFVTYGR